MNKRTPFQREQDYATEATLYLRGLTQARIAQKIAETRDYKLSNNQISQDLMVIRERWLHSSMVDFNAAKAKELARIDELERAYWEGWEASRQKAIKTFQEQIDDKPANAKPEDKKSRLRVRKHEETRDGNVTFLQGIQWCVEARCKIFGFFTPVKIETSWRNEAQKAGVEPSEVFNELVGKFVRAVAPMDGSDGSGGMGDSTEYPESEPPGI